MSVSARLGIPPSVEKGCFFEIPAVFVSYMIPMGLETDPTV